MRERFLSQVAKRRRIDMDRNEKLFIDSLRDRNATNSDILSSIEALEVLLSLEALPVLVEIIVDESRPITLRERAARAINAIGPDYIVDELQRLAISDIVELRRYAHIALRGQV
jgi:hypothetical protein